MGISLAQSGIPTLQNSLQQTQANLLTVADAMTVMNASVNHLGTAANRALFVQTTDKTITGTSDTSVFGEGVGSLSVPVGLLAKGRVLVLDLAGVMQVAALAQTLTLTVKLGSTVLTTLNLPGLVALAGNRRFGLRVMLVVQAAGAIGKIRAHAILNYTAQVTGVNFQAEVSSNNSDTNPTINLTTPQALDVTAKWSTTSADNKFTNTVAILSTLALT